MATATRRCEECAHFYYHVGADMRECQKGHKPRFYYAQLNNPGVIPGWKRRCEDFKDADHEPRKP